MLLRERWTAWPWDVRLAYATVGCYAVCTALIVALGPQLLLLLLSGCLFTTMMAVVFLIVAVRLIIGPQRLARVPPLVLTFGCLAFAVAAPDAAVDLHLITRVYMSGGPDAINRWGQGLIREQQGVTKNRIVKYDQLPPGIRDHLPGWASVGGTLWSDLPRVRIELGGGFYHYGVVVYPSGSVPTAEWWQWVLDWPAEVIIYHED
jgi:hypothetical protein